MKKATFFPNNILQVLLLVVLLLLFGALINGVNEYLIKFYKIVKTEEYTPVNVGLILLLFILIIHFKNKLSGVTFDYGFNIRYANVIFQLTSIIFLIQFGIIGSLSFFFTNDQLSNPFNTNVLQICSILIIGPITEEFLFRGIIFKGLIRTYTFFKALSISTLFFFFAHINFGKFNFIQVLLALIMGVFLGWIYYRSNNILLCIILHSLTNFLGMLYDYFYYSLIIGKHEIQKSSTYLLFIPLFISVVLIVFLILQVKNKTVKHIE